MSTIINTKQLRENMHQVVRDLAAGKSIQLTYRHRVIGVLQPANAHPVPLHRGSAGAIQNYLHTASFGPIPAALKDSELSAKQQIAKLRARDLTQE